MNPHRSTAFLLLLTLLLGVPALAADPPEEEEGLPVWEAGVATLDLGSRQFPIGYSVTPLGPLFSLHTLVANLGGELKLGPMNQSHELTLGEGTYIFGPDSTVVTEGTEMYPLSQPPRPADDGVKVPLELMVTVWGGELDYDFRWQAESRTLAVRKLPAGEQRANIDLVHLQGVTTVVVQFQQRPRYRIRQTPGQVSIELLGDRLSGAGTPMTMQDPLVRQILQTAQGIRVVLAKDTEVHDYTLQNPFRIVLDVYRSANAAATPQPDTLSAPLREQGIRTIVIDPGHGGENRGALGSKGVEEKQVTLVLAQMLRTRLLERLPVQVVLTRNEDVDLPLDTRTSLANQQKADLFISLHLNSVHDPGARGAETYFSSLQASDDRAAEAAAIENRGDPVVTADGDPLYDLQLILWDLAQSHFLAESQQLASLVQEELNGALGLRNRGVKQAPFRVLLGAAMPAILVECGFLSNPEEQDKLLDPAYRSQLVDALMRAIMRYRAQKMGLPQPVDTTLP